MKTNIFSAISISLLAACAISTSCSGDSSYPEPQDAIDGYGVQIEFTKWRPYNLDGTETFAGQTVITDQGNERDAGEFYCKEYISPSVNGFFKTGSVDGAKVRCLVSQKIGGDGKLVGLGDFEDVGLFYEDVVPSVKVGEGIKYIDREGNVAFDINEKTGLNVKTAYNFMGGISVIGVDNGGDFLLKGAVNTKGEIVIEPRYFTLDYIGSGLYYAIDPQRVTNPENPEVEILDNTGKVRFTINKNDYYINIGNGRNGPYNFPFKDGYGLLSDYSGFNWVILDSNGKELLKSDGTKSVNHEFSGKYFVFRDSETYFFGIMDIKGNIVIPAEEQRIIWLDKEMFCRLNERDESEVCDYKGKVLFTVDGPLSRFNHGYAFVPHQGRLDFINSKGETVNTTSLYYGAISYWDVELLDPIFSRKE
ncbi:MAG: hypothetical protein ACI30Q_08135 [Muribaculaceae bacterium]